MNPSVKSTKPSRLFLFLAAAFCFFRLIPIFTAIERIYHYDELNIGFVATEWLSHPALSLWHYQFDSYGGESLALGFLAIPFVKLLGPTLLAVKIPSFLFALATYALMVSFTHRFFGMKKALLTGLLMIFCHPAYVQFSLTGMTGHTEALFFAVAMMCFFYQFLYSPHRSLSIFLCGICGGIGFWIYNESIIIILVCLLSWGVLDKASFKSRFPLIFAAGLSSGLLPWFAYNFHHQAKGFTFFAASAGSIFSLGLDWKMIAKKAVKLFTAGIPFSFNFFSVFWIHERLFSLIYFAFTYLPLLPLAAGKILHTLKTGKDPEKVFPLLLFPVVFLSVFLLAPFDIAYTIGYAGYRYLSPLHLFLLPLPALLLPPGKAKKFLIGAILALGFLGQTTLFFREPFGRAQTYKGNSYYQMGTTLRFCLWPRLNTLQDIKNEFESRDPESRYFFLWGVVDAAMSGNEEMLLAGSSIHADAVLPAFTGASDSYLYEWKGSILPERQALQAISQRLTGSPKALLHKGFFENWDGFSIETFTGCPRCFDSLGPDSAWARFTIGRFYYYNLLSSRALSLFHSFYGDTSKEEIEEMTAEIEALNLSSEEEAQIYRGIALANFRTSWDSNILIDRSFQNLLNHASPESRAALFWGIGWVARAMYREDRQRGLNQLEIIPSDGKPEALKGFASFEEMYGVPPL